ncbi:hypothetical protein [Nocardioides sp. 503]|uniref:hypothetical protein n=1 Tax=Nocardioides sp. 503 TaxID=2508326 RepID=UPI00106F2404|nr:hypothetical protein [Nocardioides sp. 503]
MVRTALAALVTPVLLALGLASASAPSSAVPDASSERSTVGYEPTWGRVRAPDQTLRRGCRSYRFAYRVTPPGTAWTAEVRVLSPRGRAVASRTFVSESDPAAAVRRFRVCRAAVAPGRFTLRMLVTSYAGTFDQGSKAHVRPTHFRLRRPR